MTIDGAVHKTLLLLALLCSSAFGVWHVYFKGMDVLAIMLGGGIAAFLVAMIAIFVPKSSPVTGPLYAVLEGLFIGGITATYEEQFGGITIQAVLLTFGVLFSLLLLYRSRLIRATENFKLGVFAATLAVLVVYLVDLGLRLFGMEVPFLHETGWIGILISLVIVGIAALNLVLDFDFIEQGAEEKAPKYMEWYAAFGLMLTLVWLYLEILRLLGKIYNRN